jgi:hypothetical protein
MAIDENNARQQETELAQTYLDTAILGREVAGLALQQALRDAKAGNLRDPGKTAVSAITASAIALDKRLVLQERPTQIIALDPGQALNALARRVGYVDTTAVDVTATPELEPGRGFPQSYAKPQTTESANPSPAEPEPITPLPRASRCRKRASASN